MNIRTTEFIVDRAHILTIQGQSAFSLTSSTSGSEEALTATETALVLGGRAGS